LEPNGSVTALLAAAGWPDVAGPVLVAGRQPALGCVAAFLLSGVARPSSVGKGARVVVAPAARR
jgi:hypothetical protein